MNIIFYRNTDDKTNLDDVQRSLIDLGFTVTIKTSKHYHGVKYQHHGDIGRLGVDEHSQLVDILQGFQSVSY